MTIRQLLEEAIERAEAQGIHEHNVAITLINPDLQQTFKWTLAEARAQITAMNRRDKAAMN